MEMARSQVESEDLRSQALGGLFFTFNFSLDLFEKKDRRLDIVVG